MNIALAGSTGKADSVRLASVDDIDQLLDLEQRCFVGDRLSPRSFRRLLRSASAATLIAETGYLLLLFRRNSKTARIYSVAVAPEARGRGTARSLVEHAEAHARARGCEVMQLEVRVDNHAAIRLYESLGYVGGERLDGYYEDGQAARRYRKPLSAGDP
jgi:ribosomal protein S18 acetylase RimI-like enzyme